MRYRLFLFSVFWSVLRLTSPLQAEPISPLSFDPPEWKFGMIEQGSKQDFAVTVSNSASNPVSLDFISTCACMEVHPSKVTIPARSSFVFKLNYDSADDSGITRKAFIVNSDIPGSKPSQYLLDGIVRVVNIAHGGAWVRNSPGYGGTTALTTVTLLYYYTPGCKSCTEFLSFELPKLEHELGLRIEVERKDILDPGSWEELSAFANSLGTGIQAMPALRAGNTLLQGEIEIRKEIAGILQEATRKTGSAPIVTSESPVAEATASTSVKNREITILSIIAAGLIDGINPCAFTTLVFLIASLALAGKGRIEILAIGVFFSIGVFITYLAIGLGVVGLLRIASTLSFVSVLLRWVLAFALLAFSALSMYDYFLIRSGRQREMLLQLPDTLKRRIHTSIRTRTRTALLAGSSLTLGILVSIFEFACTGQVYLPTLAYMVHARKASNAFPLLLLYNLCFIVPLIVVFIASFLGVSSKRIAAMFQSRLAFVKLLLAFAFLCLAILTVAT